MKIVALAATVFDVFVTADGNLPFQTGIQDLRISVIVLRARTSRLADMRTLVPDLLAAISSVAPGSVHVIHEK